MPTRNVVLTDHQQELVEALVASGRYQNASEVLREGLRMVEHRAQEDAIRLDALREAVGTGLAAARAGKYESVADADLDNYIQGLGASPARGVSL